MSAKYGISFVCKDDKEVSEIRTKFNRHNMEGNNKKHFLDILDYFNFHRDDIKEKIKLEKAVVPLFMLRVTNSTACVEREIKNETYPRTITCGETEYTLKESWFYKVKDFIKKYKIVEDLVYLNINVESNSVFLTVENIKEGDGESMSEKQRKVIISVGFDTEEERDGIRSRLLKYGYVDEKSRTNTAGLKNVLDFVDKFDLDLVMDKTKANTAAFYLNKKMEFFDLDTETAKTVDFPVLFGSELMNGLEDEEAKYTLKCMNELYFNKRASKGLNQDSFIRNLITCNNNLNKIVRIHKNFGDGNPLINYISKDNVIDKTMETLYKETEDLLQCSRGITISESSRIVDAAQKCLSGRSVSMLASGLLNTLIIDVYIKHPARTFWQRVFNTTDLVFTPEEITLEVTAVHMEGDN